MTDDRAVAPGGVGWVASVTIDAADPMALAKFWSELLGLAVRPRDGRFVTLQHPPTGAPPAINLRALATRCPAVPCSVLSPQ
jgi:hypothetical protein